MNRNARLVILYAILAACILNMAASIATGKQPPTALYGVLGTIGTYVLIQDDKDKDDDDEIPKKRKLKGRLRRGTPPDPPDNET